MLKIFTKSDLVKCAYRAGKWNYNRQINDKAVDLPDSKFPVLTALRHHYRAGVPCKTHMRCIVELGDTGMLIVDVPMPFYERLQVIEHDTLVTKEVETDKPVDATKAIRIPIEDVKLDASPLCRRGAI